MKRLIFLSLIAFALTIPADAQFSRTNRLWRPCPSTSTPASVAISSVGAITLTTCSGQTVTNTGGVVVNNFTSLTTATTGDVTYNSPSLNLGNDTDALVSINSAIANSVRIGNTVNTVGGQINVGGNNSFVVPATLKLQLGASGANAARIDLDRPNSEIAIYTPTLDMGDSGAGPTQINLRRTITAGGVTGNATINLPNGTVNFAAAATTITVTNSTVSATSQIIVTPQRLDATCRTFAVDAKGAGTFNIVTTAACTAETSVAFWVTN